MIIFWALGNMRCGCSVRNVQKKYKLDSSGGVCAWQLVGVNGARVKFLFSYKNFTLAKKIPANMKKYS